jgi:hypothetical protein
VNIAIGLSPGISFFGHFWGMIFWAAWWYITQKKK